MKLIKADEQIDVVHTHVCYLLHGHSSRRYRKNACRSLEYLRRSSSYVRKYKENEVRYVAKSMKIFTGAHNSDSTVRSVINETLRLFPPVPLNVRESRSTCVLPPADGTYPGSEPRSLYMPAGTILTYLPLLTQRNSALWGADADEFKPERWLEPDRLAQFLANPTMYLPFSAGPRIVSISLRPLIAPKANLSVLR